MSEDEKLVAVVSPWDKLSDLVKDKFRLESLPAEKKVMVWREDLQSEDALSTELRKHGITSVDLQRKKVTLRWQDVH